jgi:glycine amidinotransferase
VCLAPTPLLGRCRLPSSGAIERQANSFDEWTRLREVVVGTPFTADPHDVDLSFRAFFHDNLEKASDFDVVYSEPQHRRPSPTPSRRPATFQHKTRYLAELEEDVNGFVAALTQAGVRVHRPRPIPAGINRIVTPYWESSTWPALNVRDRALVLGDEILETTPCIRGRYFETDLLKDVFFGYFLNGSGWSTMPRPMMTDASFDLSDIRENEFPACTEPITSPLPTHYDIGHEIMIDGAQCVRFGQDVIVNVGNRNHELGLEWLTRHFSPRFRFHRLSRLADNHIDSKILPLRPGLLLLRNPGVREFLPAPLQKWDVVYPPPPDDSLFPMYEDDDLVLASQFIDMNVLSLDEKTVVANSLNPGLLRVLESAGCNVIPVQHRHRRLFSGGFHCFTLDTVRDGGHEDYFS